ncbi:hypothetical protein DFS34DRAFT_593885 [Phlyctochytrium arcticum]|nr:hypothetical protein DFS34DRAFT_593885 [Phlyctochytrium arcticum]
MKVVSLLSTAALAVLAATGVAAQTPSAVQCAQGTIVRKSVRDLNEQEWQTYMKTIQTAMTTPAYEGAMTSIWERFAEIHNALYMPIHGNGVFLFWHRWFLSYAEGELRKLDPNFSFPYWSTELEFDSRRWANDPIWKIQGAGTGPAKDIQGGAWGNITFNAMDVFNPADYHTLQNCKIRRAYNLEELKKEENPSVLAKYRLTSMSDYIEAEKSCAAEGYSCWSPMVEALHGLFHVANGGMGVDYEGHMSSMYSPIDPLFWLHHANVDRVFDQVQQSWRQAGQPAKYQIAGNCPESATTQNTDCLTPTSPIPGFALTVADVESASQLCVSYTSAAATAAAVDQASAPSAGLAPAAALNSEVIKQLDAWEAQRKAAGQKLFKGSKQVDIALIEKLATEVYVAYGGKPKAPAAPTTTVKSVETTSTAAVATASSAKAATSTTIASFATTTAAATTATTISVTTVQTTVQTPAAAQPSSVPNAASETVAGAPTTVPGSIPKTPTGPNNVPTNVPSVSVGNGGSSSAPKTPIGPISVPTNVPSVPTTGNGGGASSAPGTSAPQPSIPSAPKKKNKCPAGYRPKKPAQQHLAPTVSATELIADIIDMTQFHESFTLPPPAANLAGNTTDEEEYTPPTFMPAPLPLSWLKMQNAGRAAAAGVDLDVFVSDMQKELQVLFAKVVSKSNRGSVFSVLPDTKLTDGLKKIVGGVDQFLKGNNSTTIIAATQTTAATTIRTVAVATPRPTTVTSSTVPTTTLPATLAYPTYVVAGKLARRSARHV